MTATKPRRTAQVPDQIGVIKEVAPGTLGEELELTPGDRIVRVNGRDLTDALDFQFFADEEELELEVRRDDNVIMFEVQRDASEAWGITFEDPTFDGIHICENACPFCFIKQLPKGMRKSLYVMDDDYRYSMLYGNFITLTNLTEEDWQRIEDQHISPINVSVHATNPDLRVALVGNPKAGEILDQLARLDRAGIEYNTQLVLCPGINDGAELDRSIEDLLSVGPYLKSIAAVPVGMSKFGIERQSKRVRLSRTCMRALPGADKAMFDVRRYTNEEAADVIDQVEAWQERFRTERGNTFIYLADEFYLMNGREVPKAYHYDGFPQVEDGIGITRLFVDDAENVIKQGARSDLHGASGMIACGMIIRPTMEALVARVNEATGSRLRVVPIENSFFGPQINVSGLLTGELLVEAATQDAERDPVFISANMISKRTHTFLDDLHMDDVSQRIGRQVIPADYLSEVVSTLSVQSRINVA